MELTKASNEWASRPDDQRFTSIADLKEAVSKRRREAWTATVSSGELEAVPSGGLSVRVFDPTRGEKVTLAPSNWAFGQLAQFVGAPAGYLRKLPPELAAINLQWGFENSPIREDGLVLGQNGDLLRALTSATYGRIWDAQVVEAVEKVNTDGRWQIPFASYQTQAPKRATTLYASDRDVFMFLVDPNNPIEVDGETLYRGFYTWNSEVGSAVFGLMTFLYRVVCDNRIIWGATQIKELRIRHTGGAPDRFAYEGAKYLRRYADESTSLLAAGISKAKDTNIPLGRDESVTDWLRSRGFTKPQAEASVKAAEREEGKARSIWDIVNGITAHARTVPHTDARVDLETKAGKLMDYVS